MDEKPIDLGPQSEHKRIVAIREVAFGLMCLALEGGFDFYQVPGGWESGAESALKAAEIVVNYGANVNKGDL